MVIESPRAGTLRVWISGFVEIVNRKTERVHYSRDRMRISHARWGNSIALDSRTVFKPGCDGEKQVLAGFVEKKEAYIEAFSFGHN